MRAIAAGVTDVGRERDHNEDRFVLLPEFEVFVVADGMGGHQCGEVASRMATATIASFFRDARRTKKSVSDLLREALVEANDRIHRRALVSSAYRGMGTTVVAAAFCRSDERLFIAHAGDSRCYRFRDGKLTQLTRDHSLLEEAVRTRPDIPRHELSYLPPNVITRALGVEPTVDVDVASERVRDGDLFLLCSDGLHGFVTDERIGEIVDDAGVLTSSCVKLVDEANANGGGDNITAVLVRIEAVGEPWAEATSVPPHPSRMPRDSGPPPGLSIDPPSDTQPPLSEDPASGADDTRRARIVVDPDAVLSSDAMAPTVEAPMVTDPEAVLAAAAESEADTEKTNALDGKSLREIRAKRSVTRTLESAAMPDRAELLEAAKAAGDADVTEQPEIDKSSDDDPSDDDPSDDDASDDDS